jgi:hypothetical protein
MVNIVVGFFDHELGDHRLTFDTSLNIRLNLLHFTKSYVQCLLILLRRILF